MNLQGLTRQEALELIKKKSTWSDKEITTLISSMKGKLTLVPTMLKPGDIHTCNGLMGHPAVIFKIDGEDVYSVLLTTEPSTPGILKKCDSRWFENSYFTSTVVKNNKSDLINDIKTVYDNNRDLKEMTKLLKSSYAKILK